MGQMMDSDVEKEKPLWSLQYVQNAAPSFPVAGTSLRQGAWQLEP